MTEPEIEERPVKRREVLSLYLEPTRGQEWPRLMSPSSRDRELRDLARNVTFIALSHPQPPANRNISDQIMEINSENTSLDGQEDTEGHP